jgi:hypothetical protein
MLLRHHSSAVGIMILAISQSRLGIISGRNNHQHGDNEKESQKQQKHLHGEKT